MCLKARRRPELGILATPIISYNWILIKTKSVQSKYNFIGTQTDLIILTFIN